MRVDSDRLRVTIAVPVRSNRETAVVTSVGPDAQEEPSVIDHLVFATTDLEATVAELTERLGVEPVPGGVHPGRGTRNELVGLGGRTYLEIIGPDHDQPDPPGGRPFGIDDLGRPRLVAWCARPRRSLIDLRAAALATHWAIGEIHRMSRTRPDGVTFDWQLTLPTIGPAGVAVLPFLIDWGTSAHPSESLDHPIGLLELRIECPNPPGVAEQLSVVGELGSVEFIEAARPGLSALLSTPSGPLGLS